MTISETIDKLKKDRSNSITPFIPLIQANKVIVSNDLISKRDSLEDFLFKNVTGSLGIETLIELYWQSLILLRTSGSATTVLTKALIEAMVTFDNTLYVGTTGALKSTTSPYITTNGLTLGATSIFDALITQIGIVATDISVHNSGYIYASQLLALGAQATFITTSARTGSGVLGSRTKDIDNLSTTQDSSPPNNWRFIAGSGISDSPNYWDVTVLTNLNTLITALTNIKTNYLDKITSFFTTLSTNNYIINKSLFTGFDSGFNTYYSNVQNQISTLTTYYNNLTTYAGNLPGNTAIINSTLANLVIDLGTFKTTNENRITAISGGNSIMGLADSLGTINYYRESIVSQLLSFPDGIIPILNLPATSSTSNTEIIKCEKLLTSYGIATTQWIPTPTMVFARYNISKTQVLLQWVSELHCNKYQIYRKESSLVTDNSDFVIGDLIATLDSVSNIDPQTNFTQQYYTDTSIPDNTKKYVYKILSIDDYWSTHGVSCVSSQSLQSDSWVSGVVNPKAITV
jgi:hypothetical protein